MKKYILLLLLISGPLQSQEKQIKYEYLEYKRPVFGLNLDLGPSFLAYYYVGLSTGIIPEFYLGKNHRVYFYFQLPLQFRGLYFKENVYNFFSLGLLVGMGGYIMEADKYNRWSVVMNGAVGGLFLFRNTQPGQGYNGTSTQLSGEGIVMYLDFLARYHVNKNYAVQFGPALDIVWPIIPKINLSFKLGLAF